MDLNTMDGSAVKESNLRLATSPLIQYRSYNRAPFQRIVKWIILARSVLFLFFHRTIQSLLIEAIIEAKFHHLPHVSPTYNCMSTSPIIERAILSVHDKTGLKEFASRLAEAGVEIFASGGTYHFLDQLGMQVREISHYTGFPEMLGGRVKTLHPRVHAGLLARRDLPEDMSALSNAEILPFELVAVNLYPFEQTIADPNVTWEQAVEQIDIGGPTLVRAAAKNHAFVTVVTSPEQYSLVLSQIGSTRRTTPELRRQLAYAAFARTTSYDAAIADYFRVHVGRCEEIQDDPALMPQSIRLELNREKILRYGENPQQRAALYTLAGANSLGLARAEQIHGKELSYNNYLDLESAWNIVRAIDRPAVAVIKHNNPCGAAANEILRDATRQALEGDATSAFGSILGLNRTLDAASAEIIVEPHRFIEAIVAPDFDAGALDVLRTRPAWKASVRLLKIQDDHAPRPWHFRPIDGGMLVQEADERVDSPRDWQLVTRRTPDESAANDIHLAWHLVRHVKSNAIVICRDSALCGVGAGQMSRVDSVEIALKKAGHLSQGAVLASDAFFPFADSIDLAANAGIRVIVQPGGSRRDQEVIDACDRHGISMLFTGRRHFRH
jgi:phosphoribosylaminoimidazolecarboxamide formyltransferase/IMP cyclohydrolase